MRKYLNIFALISLMLIANRSWAQLPIPSMDVSILGGYSLVEGMPTQDFEGMNISGALHVHINERIAVGPFFSKGVDMNFFEEQAFSGLENDADQLILGVNVRLSATRGPRVRSYLNLNFFKLQLVKDYGDYRTAVNSSGVGFGGGIMVKLNRNLYLNAIDVNVRILGDDTRDLVLESGAGLILQFQTGISYNIGRKK